MRYNQEVSLGLKHASVVTAPSYTMLGYLNKHYGSFNSFAPVYNWRNDKKYSACFPKDEYIFSAGRIWDEAKNIKLLAEAAVYDALPIYIAGDETNPSGDRYVPESLISLGKLSAEQMAERLSRAQIYALPVKYEPFGLSILEAALSGCALVVGDIESMRELWTDAAIFVDPTDAKALALILRNLLEDKDLCAQYSVKAFERAKCFNRKAALDKYMELYSYLINNF